MLLFNVLGKLPGQLFLDTLLDTCLSKPCLGTCSWEPCLGTCSWEPYLWTCSWEHCLVTCSGNSLLGTCSWKLCLLASNLFIGNWSGTCSSQLCLGALFRNLSFGTLLGILFLLPTLLADVQMFFEISLCKLFLESCSWEHEQPETMLGNVFVGTVLATYCSEPS